MRGHWFGAMFFVLALAISGLAPTGDALVLPLAAPEARIAIQLCLTTGGAQQPAGQKHDQHGDCFQCCVCCDGLSPTLAPSAFVVDRLIVSQIAFIGVVPLMAPVNRRGEANQARAPPLLS
jgi:hypothetical protein